MIVGRIGNPSCAEFASAGRLSTRRTRNTGPNTSRRPSGMTAAAFNPFPSAWRSSASPETTFQTMRWPSDETETNRSPSGTRPLGGRCRGACSGPSQAGRAEEGVLLRPPDAEGPRRSTSRAQLARGGCRFDCPLRVRGSCAIGSDHDRAGIDRSEEGGPPARWPDRPPGPGRQTSLRSSPRHRSRPLACAWPR